MGLFKRNKSKEKTIIEQFESTNDLGTMAKILAENNIISVPKDTNHNTFGDSLNHLDSDGELPFGWVTHRKNIVDQIENELKPIRQQIHNSKDISSEISAIKLYADYLKEGQKRYSQMGECEGKYFKEYIVNSMESKNRKKRLKYLQGQLKPTENK